MRNFVSNFCRVYIYIICAIIYGADLKIDNYLFIRGKTGVLEFCDFIHENLFILQGRKTDKLILFN